MKVCPNVACSHRKRTGAPAEYTADRPDCADCGAELAAGPAYYAAPSAEPAARPLPPGFSSRIAVTIVALAIAIAGPRLVPLPGVDPSALPPNVPLSKVSVFGLGLLPVIVAAPLVEIVAWLVPSLRPLRHAGPDGRAKLGRATMLLALGIALIQARGVLAFTDLLLVLTNQFAVMGSLLAGTSLLVLLATWVNRRGLGNGYALLFFGPWLVTEGEILEGLLREPLTAAEFAPILAIPVLLVFTAVACARWPARRDEHVRVRMAGVEPYRRGAGSAGADPPPLRLPASGIAPVLVLATVGSLLVAFSRVGLIPYGALAWYFKRDGASLVLQLVLTAALVLVFGWGFQTPISRRAFWRRVRAVSPKSRPLDEGDAEVLAALGRSILPLCVFVGLPLFVDAGPATNSYFLPVLTMFILDLVAEVRARIQIEGELVSVWPEHRVFAADMVAAVLRSEGIPVLLRGIHYRAMTRFVHPFVPIDVMVPESRADDATRIVRQIMLGEAPPPEVRKDEPQEPAAPKKQKKRKKKPTGDETTA